MARNYNIAKAFIIRDLRSLSPDEAEDIAHEARYGTTVALIEQRYLWYTEWREGSVQLAIDFDPQLPGDLGEKTLDDEPWQVACIRVRNAGHDTARRCTGILYLESPGDTLAHRSGPFRLHWVDASCTLERDTAEPVDILAGDQRSLDVAFSPHPDPAAWGCAEKRYCLTSGPTYLLAVPLAVRGQPPEPGFWNRGGACLAIPIALTRRGATQAYLPAGDYEFRIEVRPENGAGDTAHFRLTSPPAGGYLRMVRLPVHRATA